jgi:hypothetical protein
MATVALAVTAGSASAASIPSVPPMFFFRDPDGNRYLIVGEPD